MKRILSSMLVLAIAGIAQVSAHADAASVPVRFENRGVPVNVKLFKDGVQCDLSPKGRGILTIGNGKGLVTRNHFSEDLVAGEPVEIVFVRSVFRPARIGVPGADAIGVRTRLVPQAGMEYRVRVANQASQIDAVVEARPRGSHDSFARVPSEVSYATRDLCVDGVRGAAVG